MTPEQIGRLREFVVKHDNLRDEFRAFLDEAGVRPGSWCVQWGVEYRIETVRSHLTYVNVMGRKLLKSGKLGRRLLYIDFHMDRGFRLIDQPERFRGDD